VSSDSIFNPPPPSRPDLPPGHEALAGTLERILFLNEENHYTVGELRPEAGGAPVVVAGTLPGVQCGESLRLEGEWNRHPRHGDQFRITRFEAILPSSVHGIRRYLSSGMIKGIGKVYANKIVDTFGPDTLDVISNHSARLREVEGIGPQRAASIKRAWDEQQALREILIFLRTYGVTTSQALRLVKRYGNSAREVLRTEPYRVAREVDGIGFQTADRLALNLGFANDSPARLDAGLLYVLGDREDDGNTACVIQPFLDLAAEMLQADHALLKERLDALVTAKAVRLVDIDLVQLPALTHAETRFADRLARLSAHPSCLPSIRIDAAVAWAQERAGFAFTDEQAEAVRRALAHRVSILTGGPGTGKTTILRALVDILKAKKVRIVLASPTGRAAQRMTETTGAFAQTLHRLLRWDPAAFAFTANEDHPLSGDFFVVDETSMLDTRLATAFVRAVPPGAHVLFVGDADQLPSVGSGSVLRDLLAADLVPATRLDRVWRQRGNSAILHAAYGVLRGIPGPPNLVAGIDDISREHDFWMVRAHSPEHCIEQVLALLTRRIPELWNVDPVRDVQVLAPMHRGIAGIANLNRQLQERLNPHGDTFTFGNVSFRVGDKVIQTRNNYDHGIFNGDLGRVLAVNPAEASVMVDFDGEQINLSRSDLADLQLAYATSVHKSQGSEYPVVILPLLKQHFMLLQRNLLYTGITRGRRLVIIVGDPSAYALAARNAQTSERCTDLERKLREAFAAR